MPLPPYLGQPGYGQLISAGQRPGAGANSIFIRPGAKDPGGIAFLGYAMKRNSVAVQSTTATMLTSRASLVLVASSRVKRTGLSIPALTLRNSPIVARRPFQGQGLLTLAIRN